MTEPTTHVSSGLTSSEHRENEPLDLSNSNAAKKQHDKIAVWALQQYRAIRNARTVTERQWYFNLAFYFGKQNVQPVRDSTVFGTGSSLRLYVPPAPYYRARPVINRIRPTIRTELSQLTANRPNASIVPSSAEDRDMYAAMAGEQIWYNFYQDKNLKRTIRKAMWWTLLCGTGFMKTWWNPTEGEMKPVVDPTLGIPTGQMEPEGDVSFMHETPFHVLVPDLREEELEEQPFIIHASTRSPEYVAMNYKTAIDGSKVDPNAYAGEELIEDSFLNLVGTQNLNRQKAVLILECWVKPSVLPMFPEGAFFTLVGDKVVQGQQGWPYTHGRFPFSKFEHIPSGKFYGTSIIEDLIPLQKEYNRTHGQIIEAKNRMAKPRLAAQRGSVDASKITSEPGQIVFYTPGFDPPTPIPMQDLPSYVTQELDRILMDWSDISGQHEVSQGQVPPGVTAATAISFLQERDESKLSATFDSLEEGIEKVARMALSYVKDYWDVERLIKVTGPDGSFDVIAFKGSNLRDNTDIRIEAGSALPVSKAAKQAFIMDLMKMGFVEPQKGLEVMEMGGINKIYEQFQIDQRQVQRENLKMGRITEEMIQEYEQNNMQLLQTDPEAFGTNIDPMTGEQVPNGPPPIIPVNTWDNHAIHIEYHNQFRKGQAFENLPSHIKDIFDQHVNMHIQALGMETETMNPRKAVGLPEEEEEMDEEETGNKPGPDQGPEMSGEGPQAGGMG